MNNIAGQSQPEMAAKAIRAICKDEAKHHCITLANTLPNGSTRHSLYEMWPARVRDLIVTTARCCVVHVASIWEGF